MKPTSLAFTPFAISILVVPAIETVAGLSGNWSGLSPLVNLGMVRCLEIVCLLPILKIRIWPLIDLQDRDSSGWLPLLEKSTPAIGVCVAMLIFAILHNRLGFHLPPFRDSLSPKPNAFAFDLFFVSCILSPAAEELFFRGTVFRFFRQFGFLPALVISALLFSTFHTTAWAFPLIPLLGGLLCAVVYERGGSLVSPFLVHATGNTLLLFVLSP